jgi:hypothetical protein
MLLSNLAKSQRIETLLSLEVIEVEGLAEKDVLGQLMEAFVLGENKKWNEYATFDFLANVWGDLTRVNIQKVGFDCPVSRRTKIPVNACNGSPRSLSFPVFVTVH